MLLGEMGTIAILLVLFAIPCAGGRELNKVIVQSISFGVSPNSDAGGVVAHNSNETDDSGVDTKTAGIKDKIGYGDVTSGKENKNNVHREGKSPIDETATFNRKPEREKVRPNKQKPDTTSKIVGGVLSTKDQWPWVVSVQYQNFYGTWTHFCGGSLIHRRWVVTAAHCVNRLQDKVVRVVLGDYQLSFFSAREQVINPSKILMHGHYEDHKAYYDIAMIKLAHAASLTPQVQSISMAAAEGISTDTTCLIAGWGNTIKTTQTLYTSDYLQQSRMSVLNNDRCPTVIRDTQLCIGSSEVEASACLGDSGGPLVCVQGGQWVLAGLASYILSVTCEPTSPNVFTRMSSYNGWVESVMHMH